MTRAFAPLLFLSACSEYAFTEENKHATIPDPDILVEPNSINFGQGYPGCDEVTTIHITNVGEGVLTVSGVSLSGDAGFFADDAALTLATGESTVFDAQYLRTDYGSGRAIITVSSDDPDTPETEVGAVGETVAQAPLAETFVQTADPVDVLWIVDNSSSMGEEQGRVITEISSFYSWFETLGLDYHMGIVTTDIVDPTLSGRLYGSPSYIDTTTASAETELIEALSVGTDGQGDESGLRAAELALSEPLLSAENAGFYRPEARLVVVFLSDEPEQSAFDAAYYVSFFSALKADPTRILLAAIVGDYGLGCASECDGAAQTAQPGDKYVDVANNFGGIFGSICTCDLSPILDAIGLASTLFVRTFALGEVPTDPTTIQVWVDGVETAAFSYDSASNSIIFETAPINGSVIDVEYDVPITCGE